MMQANLPANMQTMLRQQQNYTSGDKKQQEVLKQMQQPKPD